MPLKNWLTDLLAYSCNCASVFSCCRGGMVQTNEQYEFIHQALGLYEKELLLEKSSEPRS